MFRSTIVECTGAGGMDNEDDKDFCAGWHDWGSPNCTIMDEFKYTSAASLNSSTTTAKYLDYGGGGYVFQIRGYIADLEKRVQESVSFIIVTISSVKRLRDFGGLKKGLNITPNSKNVRNTQQALKEMNWIDNRTRALIVEFSVYNAQTEYLTIAKIAAEFVGGGVVTKYRFDPRILFRADTSSFNFNTIVQIAQILFVVRNRPYMTSLQHVVNS